MLTICPSHCLAPSKWCICTKLSGTWKCFPWRNIIVILYFSQEKKCILKKKFVFVIYLNNSCYHIWFNDFQQYMNTKKKLISRCTNAYTLYISDNIVWHIISQTSLYNVCTARTYNFIYKVNLNLKLIARNQLL